MFRVQSKGLVRKRMRVTSDAKLEPADFNRIAADLGAIAKRARKTGLIAARQTQSSVRVETRWNGKESEIMAQPGDWIVTSLSKSGEILRDGEGNENSYAIKDAKFASLYAPTGKETEFGKVYRPTGEVLALYFSGGFDIVAPWGERQRAKAGYLLLNGNEVYGNNKETFEATYDAA